jgi:hypothetical protein
MSSYDLLIGVGEERLNAILAQVYASDQLRRSLFSGSQSGAFTGLEYRVDWSVGVAPTISLKAPTQDEWSAAIKGGGAPAAPQSGAFLVNLSSLSIKLQATGESLDTTVPVRAICTVAAGGGALSISALAVIVNLNAASDLDRYLIESVMVPTILDMLNKTLSGISIPQVNVMGMALTPPVVGIMNGYLLTAFNLVNSGTPSPDGAAIPGDPFFILLSRQLVQSAVDFQVRSNLQGKTFDQSGSEGGGGFSAEYSVHGRIDGITAATTSNPTALRANASLSMSASAGITTPVGVVVRTIEDIGKKIIDPDTWNPTKW